MARVLLHIWTLFAVTPPEPKAAVEVQLKPAGSQGSAPGPRRRLHPPPHPKVCTRCTAVSCSFNEITSGTRLHFKSREKKSIYKQKRKTGGGIEKFGNTGLSHVDTHTLSHSLSPIG